MAFKYLFVFEFFAIIYGSDDISKEAEDILCQLSCKYKNLRQTECSCEPNNIIEIVTDSPYILCKSDTMISFRFEESSTKNYTYVVEKRTRETPWEFCLEEVETESPTFSVYGFERNKSYKIRTWIILTDGNFFSTVSQTWIRMTAEAELLPVREIILNKYIYYIDSCAAVIEWLPASDLACFYSFVVLMGDDYQEHTLKDTTKLFKETIHDLSYDSTYTVGISAIDLDRGSKTLFINFNTPTCADVHANLSICPPNQPENVTVTEIKIDQSAEYSDFDFKVAWYKPEFKPDLYSIEFLDMSSANSKQEVNVSGENTFVYLKNIKVHQYYIIGIRAYSTGGWSRAYEYAGEINITEHYIHYKYKITVIGFGLVMAVLMVCSCLGLLAFKYHQRDNRDMAKTTNQECLELEERNEMVDLSSGVQGFFGDKWELDSNAVSLQHELGNGAFGIVKHGWLVKANYIMEVAVKIPKSNANREELHQFGQELEIMKCVGNHPHIVSLLGCCIKKDLGPLLVVEYCAKGDLQKFLRGAYEKIMNTTSKVHRYDDLMAINSQSEIETKFVNEMYDNHQADEAQLNSKDLLSFARQIAMGMEYLASVKVIHRDLAARNVVVCDGKKVKVSDFGLSRDVYVDNVYQKTAVGKLPVKWMAIESLTHQRYTSQSDVWSFGILLWEIVTLGANPYPDIPTETLFNKLKTGYRMECPANCSKEIYNIMLSSWKPAPKDRPTFSKIKHSLEKLLENETEYLHLDMFGSEVGDQ